MFLIYYKAIILPESNVGVIGIIGRTSLTKTSKAIGIKNTLMVHDEDGNFIDEGNRLYELCDSQNIFEITGEIDSDIAVFSRTMLSDIYQAKIQNPNDKISLKISVEKYTEKHMFYLDWLDSWITIQEYDPTLIGKYYLKYVKNIDGVKTVQEGTFETI